MTLFSEIMADGPLGFWRTGGPSNSQALDVSGNNRHLQRFSTGSLSTSPADGPSIDGSDPVNPSIQLTGIDNCWDNTHYTEFNLTTAVSISFLFKATAVGASNQDLVRKGGIYGCYLSLDSKVHVQIRHPGTSVFSSFAGATTIVAGTIYHVGMTYDSTTIKLYVNGVLDGSVDHSGGMDTSSESFTIGLITNAYIGLIDEVALFDHALDASRFAAYYDAATTPPAPPITTSFSGGTGNASGAASIGGTKGAPIPTGLGVLFAGPTAAERAAGLTDYRAIYLTAPEDITDVTVWISVPTPEADTSEAFGAAPTSTAQALANATTVPTSVTFSSPITEGAGLNLGDLIGGQSVPLWIRRTVDSFAALGTRSFTLAISWNVVGGVHAGLHTALLYPFNYPVAVPVTLYVNADHPDADDTRTRVVAADDPDLPFKTVQAAVFKLAPGDTCQIEPAANANPDDPLDTSIYETFITIGTAPPPAANSGGGQPTRIIGHVVDGQKPAIRYINLGDMTNWVFEDIQIGYNRGSGFDHDTMGICSFIYDVTFRNCIFTGGIAWVRGFGGLLWFDHCGIYHPFTNANFLSGAGIWVIESEVEHPPTRPGHIRFTGCHFEDILGEDAIKCSSFETGTTIEIGVNIDTGEIDGNLFKDLAQRPGADAHTDCLQIYGVWADVYLIGNRYINAATPFIASDGTMEGRIIFAKNILGEGTVWVVEAQACSNIWILHNTCKTAWGTMIYAKYTVPGGQNVRIRNNIMPWFNDEAGDIVPASKVDTNLFVEQQGFVTPWGTNLGGFPEFGTSARISEPYELAEGSAGIGQAAPLDDLGLTEFELSLLENDFFGRPFAGDIGALQGDATVILPSPRPPYAIEKSPRDQSFAPLDTNIYLKLYPVPGETIDPTTVIPANIHVIDIITGISIPFVASLSLPDVDGFQTITIDLKGSLSPLTDGKIWPRVAYQVTIDGVTDTSGAEITPQQWIFRGEGGTGPSITADSVGGWKVGVIA